MSGRVAVAFPLPLEEVHLGKDVFLIPEGLRRLGFDVELHTPKARGEAWPLPVVEAGPGGLDDPAHWRGRDLDGVVVISFLRHATVLAAAREAGARVVAKADTTGEVIARVHPRATFEYALHDRETLWLRALLVASWLARLGPLHRREAGELVRALGTADATTVETTPARDAVLQVLARRRATHLASRLAVVPNPVADPFVRAAVPAQRERLVLAVGRWDLAVKDAPLMAAAFDGFLGAHDDYRAIVVGAGGEATWAGVGRGRVEHVGRMPQDEIVALLGRARVIVTSSRWESFSLSSHEGLAMGCTVAGPALAPLKDIVSLGPYGTLAPRRDVAGLAAALARETQAWERGDRDPGAIAATWRARLDLEAVARRYSELLGLSAAARVP
jgi:glycosyltransferase involved in cell wall biosynthesis